tara:strand:- start:1932 stop:2147 length:216 start_codon:yes stop_codon:yes gene_type:complete
MTESLEHYNCADAEFPGKAFEDFDKKVKKIFKDENEPNVKPEQVFEGYKKVSKGKLRRSKRKKKKEGGGGF